MKSGKVLIGAILIATLLLGLSALILKRKGDSADFVRGIVLDSEVDSKKRYKETQINLFDPETEWKPGEKAGTSNQPEISGQAGMVVDINTGNILFDKNSTQKRPIASLIKIMTAIVALEHKKPSEKIYITNRSSSIGENTMGLTYGEVYTLEELLYGLLLTSGNDAAYAISEGVAGNPRRFVEWMNYKAEELGLKSTQFMDPSGLDNSSYSTPEDMIKITRYALKNPTFKEIVKTVEHEIPSNKEHKYVYLYNQTNLLTTYPGVAGVKTGFTEEAGLCLVTYAQNNGTELIGIVLNSKDRKGDMVLMLDHGFSTLGVSVSHNLL